MVEQLVKLAKQLRRGFLFRRLARTEHHEPADQFLILDLALHRLAEPTEAERKRSPSFLIEPPG